MDKHPNAASSWKMPGENVGITTCDMCAYGFKTKDEQGDALAHKIIRLNKKVLSTKTNLVIRVSDSFVNYRKYARVSPMLNCP